MVRYIFLAMSYRKLKRSISRLINTETPFLRQVACSGGTILKQADHLQHLLNKITVHITVIQLIVNLFSYYRVVNLNKLRIKVECPHS